MSRMTAAKGLAGRGILYAHAVRHGFPMQNTKNAIGMCTMRGLSCRRSLAVLPAASSALVFPRKTWHRANSSGAQTDMQTEEKDNGESVVIAAAAAAAVSSAKMASTGTQKPEVGVAESTDVMDNSSNEAAARFLQAGVPKTKAKGGVSDTQDKVQGLEGVGLSDRMLKNLAVCGITDLFPVQRATFSALMHGKDLLVKARTGSGKTIGFALPIIEKILAAREQQPAKKGRAPSAVILAPTRELAVQIQREFVRIERTVTAVCIYGGAPSGPQERALQDGVDVVVGTPGRVIDMLDRGALHMGQVKVFVLDEADEMLKMGFQDDVEKIMEGLPEDRQMNLWSATQPRWITQMARKYCKNLETMDMVGNNPVRTAETIRHVAAACSFDNRDLVVANMVRVHANGKRALVFCNTKMDVDALAATPSLRGSARVIHGDINQQQRERTLSDFRAGIFNVLVATDVAARGIDIPDVALVIQTKVPEDEDTFVHRSGRTGRAGRDGLNVVLYRSGEESKLLQLASEIGINFNLEGSPSTEQLLESRQKDVTHALDAVSKSSINAFKELAEELLETRGWQALAAALASMAGIKDTKGLAACSLLAGRDNYVTVQVELSAKIAQNLRGLPAFRQLLQTAYPKAKFGLSVGKIVKLRDGATFLMDIDAKELAALAPAESDATMKITSESQPGVSISIAKKLPPLKELVAAMGVDSGYAGSSQGRGGRGGGYQGRGGGGGYQGGDRQGGYGGGGGWGGGGRGGGGRGGGGGYGDRQGGYGGGRGRQQSFGSF